MPRPQFEIEELVAEYRLQPNCRDLFVEGTHDRNFFNWFFTSVGIGNKPRVLEINAVNVPPKLVARYGLEPSERSRVIALAKQFEERLDQRMTSASCIIDSDFDYLLGEVIPQAERSLRKAKKIKLTDSRITGRLEKKSDRLELMYQTLEQIAGDLETNPIAKTPISVNKPHKTRLAP